MALDITSYAAQVILQLPAQCIEGIANRDVGIFVGRVGARRVPSVEFSARQDHAYVQAIKVALAMAATVVLNRHTTADDIGSQPFELGDAIRDRIAQRRGGSDAMEGNFKRSSHGLTCAARGSRASRVTPGANARGREPRYADSHSSACAQSS